MIVFFKVFFFERFRCFNWFGLGYVIIIWVGLVKSYELKGVEWLRYKLSIDIRRRGIDGQVILVFFYRSWFGVFKVIYFGFFVIYRVWLFFWMKIEDICRRDSLFNIWVCKEIVRVVVYKEVVVFRLL